MSGSTDDRTSGRSSTLRRNLTELSLLLADCLPGRVVSLEGYRLLRRRFSATPERFEPCERRAMPFTAENWRERKLASPWTDLCIEGFPGSGNSFASNSMRHCVNRPANIESHFHQTVQLKRALHFGIPTLIVVRDPMGACSSLKRKDPRLADSIVLLRWIHYHRWVMRHIERLDVALFHQIVEDVDVLRRNCPAIAELVSGPIEPRLEYRRAASSSVKIDTSRPWNRFLIRVAGSIYAKLEASADASGASPG